MSVVCSLEIEPTTFCAANAMPYNLATVTCTHSTTEPLEPEVSDPAFHSSAPPTH